MLPTAPRFIGNVFFATILISDFPAELEETVTVPAAEFSRFTSLKSRLSGCSSYLASRNFTPDIEHYHELLPHLWTPRLADCTSDLWVIRSASGVAHLPIAQGLEIPVEFYPTRHRDVALRQTITYPSRSPALASGPASPGCESSKSSMGSTGSLSRARSNSATAG